jgi:hypothetical protein
MLKPILTFLLIVAGVVLFMNRNQTRLLEIPLVSSPVPDSPTPSTPLLETPPATKILDNNYHVFQTFNNCGPAALSMLLSYYGINISQDQLGNELRPYQNPQGDNDDKSVTVAELEENQKILILFLTIDPMETSIW